MNVAFNVGPHNAVRRKLPMPDTDNLPQFRPFPKGGTANSSYDPKSCRLKLSDHAQPICGAADVCSRSETLAGTPLLRCARCNLVAYCCRDHQIKDHKRHKLYCRAMGDINAKDTAIQATLPPYFDGFFNDDDSMERMSVYLEHQTKKFDAVSTLGTQSESRFIMGRLALEYSQYFQFLDLPQDEDGLQAKFAFLLLDLGRFEDAFDFAMYWIRQGDCYAGDDEALREANRSFLVAIDEDQSEAERLGNTIVYGKSDEDTLFDNSIQAVECVVHQDFHVGLWLAVCVAKMQLLAKKYATYCTIAVMADKKVSSHLPQDVKNTINEFLIGNLPRKKAQMAALMLEIPLLLKTIHSNNAMVLPALVNPDCFNDWVVTQQGQGRDKEEIDGQPARVAQLLKCARATCIRTPGAMEYLQTIFGQTPAYWVYN